MATQLSVADTPEPRHKRVLPGLSLSLGTSLLFISLNSLLPMTGSCYASPSIMGWVRYWQVIKRWIPCFASYKSHLMGRVDSVPLFNGFFGLLLLGVSTHEISLPSYSRRFGGFAFWPCKTAVAGINLGNLVRSNGWYVTKNTWKAIGIKSSPTHRGAVVLRLWRYHISVCSQNRSARFGRTVTRRGGSRMTPRCFAIVCISVEWFFSGFGGQRLWTGIACHIIRSLGIWRGHFIGWPCHTFSEITSYDFRQATRVRLSLRPAPLRRLCWWQSLILCCSPSTSASALFKTSPHGRS